ncbi:lysophospholipase catalytic domain-containing protein [Dipodascopsis uninucleata]
MTVPPVVAWFLTVALLATTVLAELNQYEVERLVRDARRAGEQRELAYRELAAHTAGQSKRSFSATALEDYAPTNVTCPSYPLLRSSYDGVSSSETDYISSRLNSTMPALVKFLDRVDIDAGFNASQFIGTNTSIPIGMAISGGGYRAMLTGAGFLSATDERTTNATDQGHLGGLLQATTYLTGLSGGGWLVSSVSLNNFTTIETLQADPNIWNLTQSLNSPYGVSYDAQEAYFPSMVDSVNKKGDAGYQITLTDFWGRALSSRLFNYTNGGPGLLYSDIQDSESFTSHDMPFVIILALALPDEVYDTDINSTSVVEFSPFEMGSWDVDLPAFVSMRYLGTPMINGSKADDSGCTVGFDNAGFIAGTSSSLFNFSPLNSSSIQSFLFPASVITDLSGPGNDTKGVAAFQPNPFFGVPGAYSKDSVLLPMSDGGEDGQDIPLSPLLVTERHLDIIFAVDASGDTANTWPSGLSLGTTYERIALRNTTVPLKMPDVPDSNSFLGLGLAHRPTFFGCDASNFSDPVPPIIVYYANQPYSYMANTSTLQISYSTEEIADMITNGYNMATQGNGTLASDWPTCVGCAIIHREFQRRGLEPLSACKQCMSDYCWNGEIFHGTPSTNYTSPALMITGQGSATNSSSNSTMPSSTVGSNGTATATPTGTLSANGTASTSPAATESSSRASNLHSSNFCIAFIGFMVFYMFL